MEPENPNRSVSRRTIGPDGPAISQITYGTMRLRGTVGEAASHLRLLHDFGITTHHSSHEYDSHPLYLEALALAGVSRSFEHIVKLSSPSFESNRFDAAEMRRLVHSELKSLGTERLTSVQWLVRTPDAQDTKGRIRALREQSSEIFQCFDEMIQRGEIADVSVFTYHPDFARPAIENLPDPSICDYLNLQETQNVPFLDDVDAFFALRPLAAGSMTDTPEITRRALQWPLLHPRVTTIILSANSIDHVRAAVDAAGQTTPDEDRFLQDLTMSMKAH